jgi:hypothetical protein
MHIHPEGQPYFTQKWTKSPNLLIITEDRIYEQEVNTRVVDLALWLLNRFDKEYRDFNSSDVELVITAGQDDKDTGSYYFIHHEKTSIFWLDEFDADESDILWQCSGYDHLRTCHS